jgi:hypothetical protein
VVDPGLKNWQASKLKAKAFKMLTMVGWNFVMF